jgi:hypothetical protein
VPKIGGDLLALVDYVDSIKMTWKRRKVSH